ncbi:DNA replication and repair protein radC [groundwater metagenome]
MELCLDTKNQVIREDTISIGSLNANIVHPREVFRTALIESAAHIIVAHNHPSGDPTPSREDIDITKKLVETGKIMGIDVLKENTCDKALEILQATPDGDKLAPLDLKLVESAVNGFLSEEGIKVFNQLHGTLWQGNTNTL